MGDRDPPDPQAQHRKTHRGAVVVLRIDEGAVKGGRADGDTIILNADIPPQ